MTWHKREYKPRKRSCGFDNIQFIGWDCEGINDEQNPIDEWTTRQRLVLIAVSTGETLYNADGISMDARLAFIADVARKYPYATHVFYGGSYDFNKILEGIPAPIVDELHNSRRWTIYAEEWLLRYRPRKELTIAHIKPGIDVLSEKNLRGDCDAYIRFWDVIGFFQAPFLDAVRIWLGADYPDYDLIMQGKLARLHFVGDDREFMIAYNAAEVKALTAIMEMLHAQLARLELKLTRWDGAGAVAAEVFKKYRLIDSYFKTVPNQKPEKIELPDAIAEASRYAYFGGRIESGKMGRMAGPITNYDINSAYPFAAAQLPNLNGGEWIRHLNPTIENVLAMSTMTIARVNWYFHTPRLYYPFPFRTPGGAVIFPREGERWLYAEEIKAGIRSMREFDSIVISEAWEFISNPKFDSTFSIINSLYAEREKMISNSDPAEKVLKLGLNSIYGKLCQKLGWDTVLMQPPRFHFLLFAGYITSFTRARIYEAIAKEMDKVIAICTDGIIAVEPLQIHTAEGKVFGGWNVESYDEILQLQSGVYWLCKDGVWKEKARGLGRVVGEGITPADRKANHQQKILARIEMIENGWSENRSRIHFPVKLFVTSKKARTGPKWFPRWGHWYEMHDEKLGVSGRGVELLCSGWGKRRLNHAIIPNRLTDTDPAENVGWSGDGDLGAIYDLPWISEGPHDDVEEEDLEDV